MIKKLIAALLSLSVALSLCACGDKDSSSSKADSSSAPDTTTTTAPATTTTTTTAAEPEPEPVNIFDLEGFDMGEAKTLGGNKDLNLTTLMDCEALSYGDIEAESFEIVKITDKNILLRLSYFAEEDNMMEKLISIDKETYEVKSELDYAIGGSGTQFLDDGMVLIKSGENHHEYTVYDYDMNVLSSFESESYRPYYFTDTNTAYYLSYNLSAAYRYDVKTQTSKMVSDSSEYYVSDLSGVERINGEDILRLTTVEEDLKNHSGVLNTATGELTYFDADGYYSLTNGLFSYDKYAEDYSTEYSLYSYSKDNAVKVSFDDNERYYLELSACDNKVIYYTYSDYIFSFEVLDIETGKLIGTCSFDSKEIMPDEDEVRKKLGIDADYDVSYYTEPSALYESCFLDDDTLILAFSNMAGYKMYVTWDLSMQDGYESTIQISDCKDVEFDYDESSISQTYTILQPSEVSDELKPLREKADKLEEKYGIEILFENEAVGYMGTYYLKDIASSISYFTPYEVISSALDDLDTELARYPEGFFDQVSNDGCKGYRFIFTGDIISLDKQDPTGFKYAIDGSINVVIQTRPQNPTVLHHELSHSIDHYVEEKLEGTLDFSEGWDKLNPPDDIWYTGELTPEEVHAECVTNNIDPSGAYYFSEYGHTNATEDRAEIFSAVMRPENYVQFELDRSPFIVAKLNYYAECIRLAFDGSENWDEIPWEKYMDN
ncbi:MAG: hypothetical protein IJC65_00180 [Oscillospiraceae bacterium]|nr:hypothetical protein [Oscillospiraceae bacterium]